MNDNQNNIDDEEVVVNMNVFDGEPEVVSPDMPTKDFSENYADNDEIETFEKENGVKYLDLKSEIETEPMDLPGTVFDGKTEEEVSYAKDIPVALASGIYGAFRTLFHLGAYAGQKVVETMTGEELDISGEVESYTPKPVDAQTGLGMFIQKGTEMATFGVAGKGLMGVSKGFFTKASIPLMAKTKIGGTALKLMGPALNGMALDGLTFWEDGENLSNIIENNTDNPVVKNISGALSIDGDDSTIEKAVKQALEGAVIGAAVAPLAGLITSGVKAAKSKGVAKLVEKKVAKESAEKTAQEIAEVKLRTVAKENVAFKPAAEVVEKKSKENFIRIAATNPDIQSMSPEMLDKAWETAKKGVVEATEQQEIVLSSGLDGFKKIAVDAPPSVKREAVMNLINDWFVSDTAISTAASPAGGVLRTAGTDTHVRTKKILDAFFDKASTLDIDALSDMVAKSDNVEEMLGVFERITGTAAKEGKMSSKLLKRALEIQRSSLLASSATIARNIFSGLEMLIDKPITTSFASAYTNLESIGRYITRAAPMDSGVRVGEVAQWAIGWKDYLSDMTFGRLKDSSKKSIRQRYIQNAYKPSKEIATETPKGFVKQTAHKLNKALDVGYKATTEPDLFIEGGNFSASVREQSYEYLKRLSSKKKLTKEDIDMTVNTMFRNITQTDSNVAKTFIETFDNELTQSIIEQSIYKNAIKDAQTMAFKGSEGFITKSLVAAVNHVPIIKAYVPFVRTGSNIVFDRVLGDRTVLGILSPRVRKEFMAGGRSRAMLMGKQAIGATILTAGMSLYHDGFLTGDFSDDVEERKAQIAAGFQPNSVTWLNKDGVKQYVSYDNLGPLAMLMKLGAKISQANTRYANKQEDAQLDYELDAAVIHAGIAVGNEVMDEGLFRFTSRLFTALRDEDSVTVEGMVNELAVKPAVNMIPRYIGDIVKVSSGREYQNEVSSALDILMDKIGMETKPKLDMFGRPIRMPDVGMGLVGIKKKEREESFLLDLMANGSVNISDFGSNIMYDKISLDLTPEQSYNIKKKLGDEDLFDKMERVVRRETKESYLKNSDNVNINLRKTYKTELNRAIKEYLKEDDELNEMYLKRKKKTPIIDRDWRN